MDVTEIRDHRALTTFYRDCLHRAVLGSRNQDAIARQHIEVCWMPAYGEQIELCVCEGLGNSLVDISWSRRHGARIIHPPTGEVGRYSRSVLTAWVHDLLTRHGVIDANGVLTKRGIA